jgi:23S rRNA (cytosine1962-C5)-methyltransferase
VDEELFAAIVREAAADARASMVLVEKRLQSGDHPVLLGVPETSYLKCLILRKLS